MSSIINLASPSQRSTKHQVINLATQEEDQDYKALRLWKQQEQSADEDMLMWQEEEKWKEQSQQLRQEWDARLKKEQEMKEAQEPKMQFPSLPLSKFLSLYNDAMDSDDDELPDQEITWHFDHPTLKLR